MADDQLGFISWVATNQILDEYPKENGQAKVQILETAAVLNDGELWTK